LAWQLGGEEEQPEEETTVVEEALSHITLPEYEAEVSLEDIFSKEQLLLH
jgi:hypothetical protein